MDSRKIACGVAAVFIGTALAASSSMAFAQTREPLVVSAPKVDAELQRRVSYADLNLAASPAQRVLHRRIFHTSGELCFDLNGDFQFDSCRYDAVRSTDGQVAAAIERAKRQMAGLPVGPAVSISIAVGGSK